MTKEFRRTVVLTCIACIVVMAGLLIWALALFVTGRAEGAQPCPGIVRGGANVNIRSTPSTLGNAPVSTLAAGTPAPAQAATAGWHTLCDGGFISGSVVTYSTNTPVPFVSFTPSPTRLVTNTAVPPAMKTQMAARLAVRVCITYGGQPPLCSLFPLDAKVSQEVVEVQP